MKRVIRLDDPLGHLIPPGALAYPALERGLIESMERRKYLAGHGVPSVPTRYVVRMSPADRAWLDPTTEDLLARALTRYAERADYLIVGSIEVELEVEPSAMSGRPTFWVGFVDEDLLVLGARAALDVFSRR